MNRISRCIARAALGALLAAGLAAAARVGDGVPGYPHRKLAKLEALGFRHLLDSGETVTSGRLGLKGDPAQRLVERMDRRLARQNAEVRVSQVQTDELGNRHVRLSQFHRGIPIIGADMVIHVNGKNEVYGMGGDAAQALALPASGRVDGDSAERSAVRQMGADLATRSKQPPRLVIFDNTLAYEMLIPGEGPDLWLCYVDANTGAALAKLNRVLHAAPVGGAPATVHGLILVDEGGTDENVNGWLDNNGNYFMRQDSARWGVYNEDAADWEQQRTNDWGATDRAAVSLGRNLAIVQDYVKNVLHRNSFDNHGAFAEAIAHSGTAYVNAYWDGSVLNFGDGDGVTANPLTSMDVVAHEYGHAITQYTSNLTYAGESGALNESYSDIMGTLVEFYAQPDGRSAYPAGVNGHADYLIGEDCWLSGEALRDMENPLRFGQPSYYGGTLWNPGNDVHENSGVQNFAFYLLAEGGSASNDGHPYNITGLGTVAAGKVALYANMYLLTSSATYRDSRDAWVLAATTLGYDAATVSAVWTAAGLPPLESHIAVSPSSLSFGSVTVGTARSLSLTLRNDGGSATIVNAIAFTNPAFSLAPVGSAPPALPFAVPAGGSLPLAIQFSAADLSAQSGEVTITSNALDNPSLTIHLTGNGAPAPVADLTPATMLFSLSPLSAPADQTAVLSNQGGADLLFQTTVSAAVAPTFAGAGSGAKPIGSGSGFANSAQGAPRLEKIYAAANYSQPLVPGQAIVAFKPGSSGFADANTWHNLAGGEMAELAIAKNPQTHVRSHGGRRLFLVKYDAVKTASIQNAIDILKADANVAYAEPNYRRELLATPNDPSFSALYAMHNTGQTGGTPGADIHATQAWDRHTGNKSLVLGEIDTGIDYTHPDLAANVWVNAAEANGLPGVDDDGNGFVDDVHGYDFINGDSDPMDDHYHGSHVAGTIAGVGNNGVGVVGVNWTANVAALKIFDASGSTTDAAILNAVDYSNAMDMKITSNSWGGGPYSQSLFDLIQEAQGLGHLFIAAAGNNSSNNDVTANYPSNYALDNIIAVAATDNADALAYFSNYGATTVHLGAPGVDIYSCQPGGLYQYLSGTSMATPHVSGAAFLVWSFQPSLSGADVKRILLAATDPVPALSGITVTGGRLNIAKALDAAGPNWLAAGPASGNVSGGSSQPLTVTVDPSRLLPGSWSGQVRVASNDPAHPALSVAVTAVISACKNVTITPSRLDFGSTYVGTTGMQAMTLENHCNEAATITGITIDNPLFAVAAALPLALPPFGQAHLDVTFSPVAAGAASGSVIVLSDDPSHPSQSVALAGASVLGPMLHVSPGAGITASAVRGGKVVRGLALRNDGGMPLNWRFEGVDMTALADATAAAPVQYGPEHFVTLEKGAVDMRVGAPVLSAQGGPDRFGHRWLDSDAPGGPAYVWNDIKLTGIPLSTASGCDDCSESHALSFAFPFFGTNYSAINIASNGILTFGAGTYQYSNYPMPSTSEPLNAIAPFHDDLYPPSGGRIYFQDFGDRAIIQYDNVAPFSGSGTFTFQAELRRDGTITFYYNALTGATTSCTVGIQNAAGDDGLGVAYNTAYLRNGLALRFQTQPPWVSVSELSGTLAPGDSRNIGVTLDATALAVGTYATQLQLTHNGLNTPSPMSLPVNLNVVASAGKVSRVLRVGPAAQSLASGTQYQMWNFTVGGETRGMARGNRYLLYLK